VDLYDRPDVYAALRAPQPEIPERICALARAHVRGEVRKVLDPACGPANWLLPMAQRGYFVAGNDLSPSMVRAARVALAGHDAEIARGDMRDLRLASAPFDLAIEVSGTSGLMLERRDLLAHLRSVASVLRSGGLFLMMVFTRDSGPVPSAWESGEIPLPDGGLASVRYEVMSRVDHTGVERIRRTVRTHGVQDCPPQFAEEYSVRTWTWRELHSLVAEVPEFRLGTVLDDDLLHPIDEPAFADRPEVVAMLHRV